MTTTPAAPISTRRVVLVAGAIGLVLSVLIAAALVLLLRRDDGPGPLRFASTPLRFDASTGTEVAFAAVELRNPTADEAIIEDVTAADPPFGLDVSEVRAISSRDVDEAVGAVESYALPSASRPARGTVVPAGGASSVQLAFVLKAGRPGRYPLRRATVRYRVGDERHVLQLSLPVTLCSGDELCT